MRPALLLALLLPACFSDDVKDVEDFGEDDGSDGVDGVDGADGGRDSGTTGRDSGTDGADGVDGTDDSGGRDGADGGADGTIGAEVEGLMEAYFRDGAFLGAWSVSGEAVSCSGCTFAFDGEFRTLDDWSDFRRQVEWDLTGYVYTNAGEYWGYGRAGGGYAYWATYDASTSGYYYYGYVVY